MPRIRPLVLALLLAAAASAQAQSDLYRCTDSAGHATFTDDAGRRELLRTKRAEACDRLSGLPVTSVPASRNTPRSGMRTASPGSSQRRGGGWLEESLSPMDRQR